MQEQSQASEGGFRHISAKSSCEYDYIEERCESGLFGRCTGLGEQRYTLPSLLVASSLIRNLSLLRLMCRAETERQYPSARVRKYPKRILSLLIHCDSVLGVNGTSSIWSDSCLAGPGPSGSVQSRHISWFDEKRGFEPSLSVSCRSLFSASN